MARLSTPANIKAVHVHGKNGISMFVFALFAIAHAYVLQWMWQTVGEPFRNASEQNERIQATNALHLGLEQRNLLQLQNGLTRAADLPSFNDTLFDDAKSLHRQLRKRLEELDAAEAAGKVAPLAAALSAAVESHTDGKPIVDRFHLRASAKALQDLEKKRGKEDGGSSGGVDLPSLYEKVKAATAIPGKKGRGSGEAGGEEGEGEGEAVVEDAEEEKKLPSRYLPSFWACLAFVGCAFGLILTHLCCYWSIAFKALMYYHPTSKVEVGSYVRVVPLAHRGAAEIVPLQRSVHTNILFFLHQRQKYEVTLGESVVEETGLKVIGECMPLLCPIDLPLGEYSASSGLASRTSVDEASEQYGENSFAIPMPTWSDLYKEQLSSPIAVFQVMCSVLWMLDEYWKYTMFTLFMILVFEATTAFQRLQNLKQLRGMSSQPFKIYAYRSKVWKEIYTNEMLPADLVSLRRVPGGEPTTVPADVVLLRGGAVCNESTLTGESIPQLKDPLSVDQSCLEESLDVKSAHRVHTLYSGTLLMQSSSHHTAQQPSSPAITDSTSTGSGTGSSDEGAAAAAEEGGPTLLANCPGVPHPPDGGCVCFVLATAFSSSQGELMRMIEFSTAKVAADKIETLGLLLILLVFALVAAGYVLHEGLKEGKKTQYELVLKAVLIITSVVPPELPMQSALAVNTALMALMKASVFCTEPFRVPYAGRLTHCLFDKTGTLTTDELTMRGVVNVGGAGAAAGAAGAASSANSKEPLPVLPIAEASPELVAVIGGCHSLLQVDGKLMGDPIELAAIRSLGWTFDSSTSTAMASDPMPKLEAAIKAAEAKHVEVKKRLTSEKNPEMRPTALEVKRAAEGIEEAKAAKDRGLARKKAALYRGMTVRIAHRHHFSSALGRMSVIAHAKGLANAKGAAIEDGILCLVKGSPEAIGPLLTGGGSGGGSGGGKPAWFDATYTRLAEQGLRVLALAYKRAPCGTAQLGEYCKQPRSEIESGLTFCGFLAFGCAVRKDSASVIGALRESRHATIMLTGDAPLTALHVANEVGMTGYVGKEAKGAKTAPPLILKPPTSSSSSSSAFIWAAALTSDQATQPTVEFSVAGVKELRAKGHDLLVTGKDFESLADAHEGVWDVADQIAVYARMSPEGKERVVRSLRDRGLSTLMCGDGGNDVGALKAADVGISLLCGFGNANADSDKDKKAQGEGGSGGGGGGEEGEKGEKGENTSEDKLAALTSSQMKKSMELARKQGEEMKLKRAELANKQKVLMQQEVQRRMANGEGAMAAQWGAMKAVTASMRQEMAVEQQAISKKYGGGTGGFMDALSAGGLDEDEAGIAPPMVKLGDASIAAPFTSKLPSIRSCVDIVRQGHCTLVSTVQQQQILMLHCLISAYSLSALSLEGSRSSEYQLIASGMLLSVASIAFSFARPVDRLSPTLPLKSIFHPALMLSVLGQLATHAGCMWYAMAMAKSAMSDDEIQAAIAFQKQQEKLEAQGVEQPEGATTHKPNLLNTVIFLVETSQQVAVMLVNYKGRPWMKGATENPALLYSLVALVLAVIVAAWELIPYLNNQLGLVQIPTDKMRYELLSVIGVTLAGSFCWDRLCVAIFAPRIFASQLHELASLRLSDFWGPKAPQYVGTAAVAGAWLYFTEGNMIIAGVAYWLYRKVQAGQQQQQQQRAGGAAPTPTAVD